MDVKATLNLVIYSLCLLLAEVYIKLLLFFPYYLTVLLFWLLEKSKVTVIKHLTSVKANGNQH